MIHRRTLLLMLTFGLLTACQTVNPAPADTSAPSPGFPFRADSPDQVGATGRPQLVEFYATYCTECKALIPTLYNLESEYDGEVDFVFLDTDDPGNDGVKASLKLQGHPYTVLLNADGRIEHRWFGHIPADQFRAEIDRILTR